MRMKTGTISQEFVSLIRFNLQYPAHTGCSISSWTWVEFTCPVAQPFLPNSHLPKQNQAVSETAKIKVNPTKVSELMETLYIS